MTPEQHLWQLIKPYIPGHKDRVENAAGVGMPDVTFTYNRSCIWIELKVAKKRGQLPLDLLHPEQKVWHLKNVTEGGKVYVIVRDNDIISMYKASFETKTECSYACVFASQKPWNWYLFDATMRSL